RPVRSAGGPTVEGGKGRRGGLGAAAPSTRSDGAAASGPSPEESTGRGPPRTPRRSGGPPSAAAPAAAAATAPGGLGGHPADGHPGQQLHRVVVPLRAAGGIGGLGHRPGQFEGLAAGPAGVLVSRHGTDDKDRAPPRRRPRRTPNGR